MDYDVVIATKNRPEALKVSIPLILSQNHKPNKMIIVDSSGDHEIIRNVVMELMSSSNVQLELVHSKANLPYQRNKGLEYVESDVVVFPDDDSLWWPGVAESIMKVYDHDKEIEIGGVCATWATEPPPQSGLSPQDTYDMTLTDRMLQKVGGIKHKVNEFLCPNPMYLHGRSRWEHLGIPSWLNEADSCPIEYMNGLCMTFRSELLKKYGFDDALGEYLGWAPSEDISASFAVEQEKILVRAFNANVCHYTFPSVRAKGFETGFATQFNRAYVLCRYSAPESYERKALHRFAIYKMLQYTLAIHSRFGRERLRGHIQAMSEMKKLLNVAKEDLKKTYLGICKKVLGD